MFPRRAPRVPLLVIHVPPRRIGQGRGGGSPTYLFIRGVDSAGGVAPLELAVVTRIAASDLLRARVYDYSSDCFRR